jgi:hypothetical protein
MLWKIFVVVMLSSVTRFAGAWELKHAPLMTDWAEQIDPNNVLPKYPRPQMERSEWLNLNGIWEFQPGDAGDSLPKGPLSRDILVPFPVESAISGVMEHYERVWYRKTFTIPDEWTGKNILLHFGAVDWEAEIYLNGTSVGIHRV